MSGEANDCAAPQKRRMNLVVSYVGKHRRVPPEIVEARFWANLTKQDGPDGCWKWTGPVNAYGYGMLRVGGRGAYVYAHRLSYELHKGAIGHDLFVLHRCDVRDCVNPAHLFLGTHEDNQRDRVQKGRGHRGERTPQAKITTEQAREIIDALSRGESPRKIAPRFGLSFASVYAIFRGENWKHLPRPDGMPTPVSRRERAARTA